MDAGFQRESSQKRQLRKLGMKLEDKIKHILVNYVVRMGGGRNWLMFISNEGLWYLYKPC
jgi:hypothetical protein